MKSAIVVKCLGEIATERFGKAACWRVLEKSGITMEDLDNASDERVMEAMHGLCSLLEINPARAMEAFGEYWISTYMPKVRFNLGIQVSNTREFILMLGEIHENVFGAAREDAAPKFRFRWKDEDTMLLSFDPAGDEDSLFVGIVRAAAKYFDEDVAINIWSANQMMIKFPPAAEVLSTIPLAQAACAVNASKK